MGITHLSLQRINRVVPDKSNILILGCQNMYNQDNYGELAHDYFTAQGHAVTTWDITGCQGSDPVDLREQQTGQYDVILQHGTLEHIDGPLYMGFKNCHDLLKVNGIAIHENPKTYNWPGHGNHYFTEDFYKVLATLANYDIIELCEEPAMGNTKDGWNICCVLQKLEDNEFIPIEQFNKLSFYGS